METWVRNLVMLGVLVVWGGFMFVSVVVQGEVPSPFVWTVPGATYAVLMGRVPNFWQRTLPPNPPPAEPADPRPERRQES